MEIDNTADNNIEERVDIDEIDDFTEPADPSTEDSDNELTGNTDSTGSNAYDSKSETKAFSERLNKKLDEQKQIYEAQIEEARAEAEAEANRKTEQLINALHEYGIDGDIDEITNNTLAEARGTSVDEIKRTRQLEAQREANKEIEFSDRLMQGVEKHPAVLKAQKLIFEHDLNAIKQAYPDEQANDVQELGDIYINLMASNPDMNPLDAYEAQRAVNLKHSSDMPNSMGSTRANQKVTRDYFTPEEVDKLPESAYDDPKIMKKIRKSMERW